MTPSNDDAVLVADPRVQPLARLEAAQRLLALGRGDGIMQALDDLARDPKYADGIRKFGLYANYVAQSVRWLDFAGRRAQPGRWETLDGSPPDPTGPTGPGVLLWSRPGATKVVVVFSNVVGGFGTQMRGWPSMVHLHRAFKPINASIVYVMGDTRFLHYAGVAGLGKNYYSCVGRLLEEFGTRHWTSIFTTGESAGGYSALRFGLDLQARGVLSFSGMTSLAPADCSDRRFADLQQQLPEAALDLVPLYRARQQRPHSLLCYGGAHPDDTRHAERMADTPQCELIPLEGYDKHGSMIECLRRKQLQPLVQRLLACA